MLVMLLPGLPELLSSFLFSFATTRLLLHLLHRAFSPSCRSRHRQLCRWRLLPLAPATTLRATAYAAFQGAQAQRRAVLSR